MTQALSYEDEAKSSRSRAAADGVGRRAPRGEGDPKTMRVDVQAARRQSSVRRRPTRDAAANADADAGLPSDPPDLLPEMPGSPSPMPPTDPTPGPHARTTSGGKPPADATADDAPAGEEPAVVDDVPDAAADAPDALLPAEAEVPSPPAERVEPARLVPVAPAGSASSKNRQGFNKHVCPFCGTKREDAAAECPHCGMVDSDETRAATTARIGPWFLLQPRNPSAPGMRFSVLRELVRGGRVLAGSVVRGPTTHQLWTYAARVRGLGYLYGICWSCNRRLPNVRPGEEADDFCLYCGALQEAPANPDQQLEVLATAEAAGASPSPKAGQVNQVNQVGQTTGGGRGVEIHRSGEPSSLPAAAASAPLARRLNTPRPLPATPGDGGDALLSTRELATAFNLDRRRTLMGNMGRFPWVQAVVGLFVLAFVVVGLWIAASVLWGPVTRMLGISGTDKPVPAQNGTATP